MRCNFEWLKQWVPITMDPKALGDSLTMAGLEVEAIEAVSRKLSGIITARVGSVESHPDADKLSLCQVDMGDGKLRRVVCGAPNVSPNMITAYAPSGACIADTKIGLKTIRGCKSDGMLCSATELGMAEDAEGIIEFDREAPLGLSLIDYLGLDDIVYDLDLTPNRADCLSILGVAREIAAIHHTQVKLPEKTIISVSEDYRVAAKVSQPDACPRYLIRAIRGISQTAQIPLVMRERLRRCGIRAIHPVVDILNYVMLEVGQPMHAFDSNCLQGALDVRWSQPKEKLAVLGGDLVQFDKKTLLIADDKGPVAIAGIIGGEQSSVSAKTTDIVLESAFFSPHVISGLARHYALQTESSHRFERGVDPKLQRQAIEYASKLIIDTLGGEPGPITEILNQSQLPENSPITLQLSTVQQYLGITLDADFVESTLTHLGCQLQAHQQMWLCTPPSYRFDLAIEEDLIEEVGRLYGYDQVPAQLDGGIKDSLSRRPADDHTDISGMNNHRRYLRYWSDYLSTNGYFEVITYSFISDKQLKLFVANPSITRLTLSNPVSTEMSVMRPSLWPGLLQVLQYNLNRQQDRICIFEQGYKFLSKADNIEQIDVLAGLAYGARLPEQWGVKRRLYDFYDVKGDIENLLQPLYQSLSFHPAEHLGLHPGKCAEIFIGAECIGYLGELSPSLVKEYKLPAPPILFELETACLNKIDVPHYQAISIYPSVRRDLAFVVPVQIDAASISRCIAELKLNYLIDSVIFDVYTEDTNADSKGVGIGLVFQDLYTTLDKHTIDRLVENIIVVMNKKFGAQLRV